MKIQKILTDNPYVDELVYYVKLLAYDTILKNEQKALENETLESLKTSAVYISCVENHATFDILEFPIEVLKSCGFSDAVIEAAMIDKYSIPEKDRPLAVTKATEYTIANYEELNSYYRMLNGLPNMGDPGIKVTGWTPPSDINIDLNKYVHTMNDLEIETLRASGVLDKLIEANPKAEYLKHLSPKKVPYYTARKAFPFQSLYIPSIESVEIYDRFKSKLELNRNYTAKTIYSEAFKYGSDYYDSFISILIIIQTMIDLLCEIQELIANKEILDLRCVQYIFESYGIPFYPEIPTKYQIAMVKNINKLLKFKSTSKNMIDICSLFGFDNVEVFKYYLLRDRIVNASGQYEFNYKEVKDPSDPSKTITVDDNSKNYDLKFLRVPLEDNPDKYIKDPSNYLDYDDVTFADPTWDGNIDHDMVKSAILDKEFNYVRSKYISIDTIYEVTKMAFQMPYFYNMIFDDVRLEENLTLSVPYLNSVHKFRMTDIFSYLYSLTYEFYNIEDTILDTTGKVLHVMGFNFKANLVELDNYMKTQGYTLKDLGVAGFKIPTSSILSYNQLLDIYVNNLNIRAYVVKQMLKADNKKMYSIYEYLYNALMITEFTNNYFKDSQTGKMASTYTEYLSRRDTILYNSLTEIHGISDQSTKIQTITNIINNIVYALDEYIDGDEFKYIYSKLPSVSSESIKSYVVKVINFFKSYKVDFLGMNTIYKFDDKLENTVRVIDQMTSFRVYLKQESIRLIEQQLTTSNLNRSDAIKPLEKIYMDISTWKKIIAESDLNEQIKESVYLVCTRLEKHYQNYIDTMAVSVNTILASTHNTKDEVGEIHANILNQIKYSLNEGIDSFISTISVGTIFEDGKNANESLHSIITGLTTPDNGSLKDIYQLIGKYNYDTIYSKILKDSAYYGISITPITNAAISESLVKTIYSLYHTIYHITDDPITTSMFNKADHLNLDELIYISETFS